MTESLTDLRECPHGPVNDCHKCIAKELVEALDVAVEWRDKLAANPMSQEAWEALVEEDGCLDNEARAVLDKAKQMVQ